MCVTVNKYNDIIGLLEDTIYPAIDNLFLELNTNDNATLSDETLTDLNKEFTSLELFERKLIFPSIVSIFNNPSDSNFAPNIPEIIRLTKSKEEKIKQLIVVMQECMQQNECSICSNDSQVRSSLESLIYSLNNNYFPLKRRWLLLLEELNPEKVNCKNRESGKCKCGKLDEIKERIKTNLEEEELH